MTPAEFLHALWPSSGHYCLATRVRSGGYKHHVFDTIDGAASKAEELALKTDVFFCIHSLKNPQIWNEREDKWSVRTHANMQEAQAFFFDIDVEPGSKKKYGSQAEALTALRDFCKHASLPRPTVVSSGGGLHVYWHVDLPILSVQWAVQAARLKALANHYGLKIDPARTTDVSSVLRVAGTFNHKTSDPRPVSVLMSGKVTPTDDFIKLLSDGAISAGISISEITTPSVAPVKDEYFDDNLDKDYGPAPKIEDVAAVCAQVARFVDARGDVSEPEWREALRIGKACEGAGELIHSLSDGYAGYTPAETEAKAAPLQGVSKCETLRRICGEGPCGECQFFKRGLTPFAKLRDAQKLVNDPPPTVEIQVGAQVFVEELPPPPRGYLRQDGQLFKTFEKEEAVFTTLIYEYDLYPVRRIRNDEDALEETIWCSVDPIKGASQFVVDATTLYDGKALAQALANKGGVYPAQEYLNDVRAYMIAYIKELQKMAKAHAQINHLGWVDEENDAFILHDRIIKADGSEVPAVLSRSATIAGASIAQKGSLEKQVELLRFYNRKEYVGHQVLVLCGLAAPIMYATGQHGIIVNATGETGASKSTAMCFAAAMWAHPEQYPINGLKRGATQLGRDKLTSVLSNLPVCVDEITNMDAVDASEMAYSITQPRSTKLVCDRNGSLRPVPTHLRSTIMICTANSSLNNMLSQNNAAATASAMRVVEMVFPKQHIHVKYEAEAIFRELKQNYGWVGPAFLREWMRNRKTYEARVIKVMQEVDIAGKLEGGERFWSALFAVVLVACEVANSLGLIAYDVNYIRQWLLTVQLPKMRGIVAEEFSSSSSLLTDYIEAIAGHIIITDNKPGMAGFPPRIPQGSLLGHYDKYAGQLHLLKAGFRDYCVKHRANSTKILDELWAATPGPDGLQRRVILSRQVKKTLGAGTDFAKAQSWCFTIDMTHPDMAGLVTVSETPASDQIKTPPAGKLSLVVEE